MELITNNLVTILSIIGLMAFLISTITEVTKGIGILKKIPTDIQIIALSMFLCLFSYLTYASYNKTPLCWYLVIGAIIGAFPVAFVAMYGWQKFQDLYKRFSETDGSIKENIQGNTNGGSDDQ